MAMESWVVYQQQMCAGETEMICYGLTRLEDELHRGSFATQNKTYMNITTIYVKSIG